MGMDVVGVITGVAWSSDVGDCAASDGEVGPGIGLMGGDGDVAGGEVGDAVDDELDSVPRVIVPLALPFSVT